MVSQTHTQPNGRTPTLKSKPLPVAVCKQTQCTASLTRSALPNTSQQFMNTGMLSSLSQPHSTVQLHSYGVTSCMHSQCSCDDRPDVQLHRHVLVPGCCSHDLGQGHASYLTMLTNQYVPGSGDASLESRLPYYIQFDGLSLDILIVESMWTHERL